MNKACCFCKHWVCEHTAGYNYSKYTWSEGSFDLSCAKKHYSESEDITTEHFRSLISKAENCSDYEIVTFDNAMP